MSPRSVIRHRLLAGAHCAYMGHGPRREVSEVPHRCIGLHAAQRANALVQRAIHIRTLKLCCQLLHHGAANGQLRKDTISNQDPKAARRAQLAEDLF